MARIDVLNPSGEPVSSTEPTLKRHALTGATIGLLWNRKVNADNLLRDVEAELRQRAGVRDFVWEEKDSPGEPAPREVVDRLSQLEAVITASAD